jgi:ArsR family transcriptional regulator, arsenate/arsenite/antimonite-responsive transcriptional repressor / arsenate reductase (thioredoxin)
MEVDAMTGAVTPELERRAGMHAALGEPVRLAIVESLAVADAAPGELSAAFGVPTNLLAHHLRVLEEAGLIHRARSEGDRRRSYVRLADDPAVTALIHPPPVRDPITRVVFVCTHNSARSQFAAAAWARVSPLPATSAGTHPARRVHPRAVRVGRRHGFQLQQARTAQLTDVARSDDLLVAVCDNAHEELSDLLPGTWRRLHWAVPDPAPLDTDEAFETAYQQISGRIQRLAQALPSTSPGQRGPR